MTALAITALNKSWMPCFSKNNLTNFFTEPYFDFQETEHV
ncbi:hypothetical protein EV673_0510 [Limnobacter thiooxidans]|nr:hypothetical protein EV673_0510 [Limnobacter thiooxidans]